MPIYQLSFYNPFREVFETKTLPYTHTYRSNFTQMVKTAFHVFAGQGLMDGVFSKKLDKRQTHVGIFDYMTLGIGYLFPKFGKIVSEASVYEKAATGKVSTNTSIAGIVPIIGYAARYLVAGIFTFLSLPIIAIVAKKTSAERKRLQANAMNHPMMKKLVDENDTETRPLQDTAKKIKKPVQDLLDIDFKSTGSRTFLLFNAITSKYNPNLPNDFPEEKKDKVNFVTRGIAQAMSQNPAVGVDINVAFDPKSSLYALIHLNMGNLAQKLEARGFFDPRNRNKPIDTTLPLEEDAEFLQASPPTHKSQNCLGN